MRVIRPSNSNAQGAREGTRALGPESPSGWLEVQPKRQADISRRCGLIVTGSVGAVQTQAIRSRHGRIVRKLQIGDHARELHHIEDVVHLQLEAHLRAIAQRLYGEAAREGDVVVPPARIPENA